jgi:hypothetical protein
VPRLRREEYPSAAALFGYAGRNKYDTALVVLATMPYKSTGREPFFGNVVTVVAATGKPSVAVTPEPPTTKASVPVRGHESPQWWP